MLRKNDFGFIIQARTGSTRFPNKILMPFYKDKSILDIIIFNLVRNFPQAQIILATTTKQEDQVFSSIAEKWNINFFQGEENDVLKRFIDCAKYFNINRIIRICSDNPFLDMIEMKKLVELSYDSNYDYISFKVNSKPAIKTHFGFWAEAVALYALLKVAEFSDSPLHHEHVTNYIYENPSEFNIHWIDTFNYITETELRFTVDTKYDFKLLQEIYYKLDSETKNIEISDLIKLVLSDNDYPDLMKINIGNNTK